MSNMSNKKRISSPKTTSDYNGKVKIKTTTIANGRLSGTRVQDRNRALCDNNMVWLIHTGEDNFKNIIERFSQANC